jgi:hypothetical protein
MDWDEAGRAFDAGNSPTWTETDQWLFDTWDRTYRQTLHNKADLGVYDPMSSYVRDFATTYANSTTGLPSVNSGRI